MLGLRGKSTGVRKKAGTPAPRVMRVALVEVRIWSSPIRSDLRRLVRRRTRLEAAAVGAIGQLTGRRPRPVAGWRPRQVAGAPDHARARQSVRSWEPHFAGGWRPHLDVKTASCARWATCW